MTTNEWPTHDPRSIPLPEEPPVDSIVTWTDQYGDYQSVLRGADRWEGRSWPMIVASAMSGGQDLAVAMPPPARPLPTKVGTLIRASGTSGGDWFENVILRLAPFGRWVGDEGGEYVQPGTFDGDSITAWTEVRTYEPATHTAVPTAELDALRTAEHLDALADAANALLDAVDALGIEDQA